MAGLRTVSFDDRNTTLLLYQGSWFQQGAWNSTNTGETGTLSSSNDPNANITFVFPVPAVAFYYYGIRRSRGASYGICVDCDPNARNFDTIDALNLTDDGRNPPVLLYSRKFQTPGVHEIILRNQPDTRMANNNSQITIDRFEIEVIDPNAPTTSSTPPATTATSSPSQTQGLQRDKSAPVGPIAGGAVGGIAIVLLFFFIGWLYWRRRKRRKTLGRRGVDDEGILTGGEASEAPSLPPVLPPKMAEIPSESSSGNRIRQWHVANPSLGSGPGSTVSSAYPSNTVTANGVARGPRREMDAGPVQREDVEDLETLPPEYEQVFRDGRRSRRSTAAGNAKMLPPVPTADKG